MDVKTPLPIFPPPPDAYSRTYLTDLVAALNRMSFIIANPGEGRQSRLVITNLTSTDYGLEVGTLFQVDGVVRSVVANRAYPPGLSATGSVGTVAVTT